MKQIFIFLLSVTAASVYAQNVGIGTATPNPSSILEINSANKGVLFPRVNDTGTVNSPMEGLIIYNKQTKSPYYFNGSQWLSLGGRLPSGTATYTDRITYQVTSSGFNAAELELFSSSVGSALPITYDVGGGVNVGRTQLTGFNIAKTSNIHSQQFNLASMVGTLIQSIEFKYYASGATVPYISYKLQEVFVESFQVSGASGGDVYESISFAYKIFGFKDWVNNRSFGFNRSTNTSVPY